MVWVCVSILPLVFFLPVPPVAVESQVALYVQLPSLSRPLVWVSFLASAATLCPRLFGKPCILEFRRLLGIVKHDAGEGSVTAGAKNFEPLTDGRALVSSLLWGFLL